MGKEAFPFPLLQLDHLGHEEGLERDRTGPVRPFQFFKTDPLMGRMLIDDDEMLLRLAKDIGAFELADDGQGGKGKATHVEIPER